MVIVDSGVRCDHPDFRGDAFPDFVIGRTVGSRRISPILMGMVPPCTGIIRKALPYAEILNVQIPGIEEGIEEQTLCRLLNYLADHVQADVINLSLGICLCEHRRALYEACARLDQKGTVILSAYDNGEAVSYPAAFSNVIGVTSGNRCRKPGDFEFQEDALVNLAAKGAIQRLAWVSPDYLLLGGNSFACAHASVRAGRLYSGGGPFPQEV